MSLDLRKRMVNAHKGGEAFYTFIKAFSSVKNCREIKFEETHTVENSGRKWKISKTL